MPRLSLVLVVGREQAFVSEFAASALHQSFTDLELLAIDEASGPHAAPLLEELAAADPRVRVHHAPGAGPGEARNLALELAEGEYVWFVGATDRLAPGALAAVAGRLAAAAPDVLVVGHERRDALGRVRKATADPGRVWDKLLRRDALLELGLRFGPGAHGGMAVVWPAQLAAAKVERLPSVAYVRNELPVGTGPEGSPFDLFAEHDAIVAFLEGRPDVPEPRRAEVYRSLLQTELALLERVPASDRKRFFELISQRSRSSGPPASLHERVVRRGWLRAFGALRRAGAAKRRVHRSRAAVSRRRGRLLRALQQRRLARYYRSRRRQPIDPDLAVFAAYWYRSYACNPRAIYERARELVPGMRGVWVVHRDSVGALPPGVEHVVAGTREYYDAIARAKYLVNNVNFPNHLVKRPGSVHVMTHHGTPLKQMGLDLRDTPFARMDFDALLRRCARWDYSVSSNAFSTLIWERVYPTGHQTLEVGYPRNDVLASAGEDDVARARAAVGLAPGRTAVLYAPTHREWHKSFTPVMDLAAVAESLGDDHVLLVRSHYFYGADPILSALHEQGRILDVAEHPSVEELCLAADVLITDYSSIMFDYAVLDRPIVIHAPDWEVYRATRGTYFDLLEEPPGVVTTDEAGIAEAFRSGAVWGADATSARAAFRARFCSLDDGHAAERVVRRVWFGEAEAARLPMTAAAR
jgi:CDP-glycerol glycerophosphotransferase